MGYDLTDWWRARSRLGRVDRISTTLGHRTRRSLATGPAPFGPGGETLKRPGSWPVPPILVRPPAGEALAVAADDGV